MRTGCAARVRAGIGRAALALMWFGYTTYPDAFFTQMDLGTLNSSPLLKPENISSFPADCGSVAN